MAALVVAALALPAGAADAATLSGVFRCERANGTTLRPGEELACKLTVGSDDYAYDTTAEVAVPPELTFDPSHPANAQATVDDPAAPTVVRFGTLQLGLMIPGFSKTVQMRFRVKDDGSVSPGRPVSVSATLRSPDAADRVIAGNALPVTPPPADLSPSAATCTDLDGAALRPGDVVECVIALAGLAGREDAQDVVVQATLPRHTAWTAGGNSTYHTQTHVTWLSPALPGGVPSAGPAPPALRFRLALLDSAPGGTSVLTSAFVTYKNSISRIDGDESVVSNVLTSAPGRAILTSSGLGCADVSGGLLLPGEDVVCTLSLVNAPGREALEDATGSVTIPAGTTWIHGGSALTDAGLLFDASLLGGVASGARKEVQYRFRVDRATEPGTVLRPAGRVDGRSMPSGVAVGHAVSAPLLVVGRPPAPTVAEQIHAAAVQAAAQAAAPVEASRICRSRRVVVVNVKPPKGRRWRSVTFAFAKTSVTGRKAPGTLGRRGYVRARLVFQGLPKGTLTVRITGRTTGGRTHRRTRVYQLCAPRR